MAHLSLGLTNALLQKIHDSANCVWQKVLWKGSQWTGRRSGSGCTLWESFKLPVYAATFSSMYLKTRLSRFSSCSPVKSLWISRFPGNEWLCKPCSDSADASERGIETTQTCVVPYRMCGECLHFKNFIMAEGILPWILLKTLLTLNTLTSSFLSFSEAVPEVLFDECFYKVCSKIWLVKWPRAVQWEGKLAETSQSVLISLSHRIWHHVTSTSSPPSKGSWKINIFE